MARELKVYGWVGSRAEAAGALGPGYSRNPQTREIMAAYSAAEVQRTVGMTRSSWQWSGGQTWNETEVALAMAEPGVVFWMPRFSHRADTAAWTRVEPKSGS